MTQTLCSKCGHFNRPIPSKTICRLYRKGASAREIGEQFSLPMAAVIYHLHRLGVPMRTRGNSRGGGKGQHKRKIALADLDTIKFRISAGESHASIARSVGVSRSRIGQIATEKEKRK